MPTATTTFTKAPYVAQLPLKAGLKPSSPSSSDLPPPPDSLAAQTSTNATLRSLYNRATRAFVYRDIVLTHSLLQSAFALLKPPKVAPDHLSDQRRKWDILRITLEATLYTSFSSSTDALPESLRSMLSESPQALASSIYSRSLSLFTPNSGNSQKPTLNPAFLPSPVLTTLVYSSLKIDAPDVGRMIIEDWLARREPNYSMESQGREGDGYAKVLDLYCLQVLPKLEQWNYAREFLDYESELPAQHRENLKTSLNNHYRQASLFQRSCNSIPSSLSTSTSSSPRCYSPAISSSSSSSSSLSTTSTHTVVPATPRGTRSSTFPSALTCPPTTSSSSASTSSHETSTPRAAHASLTPNRSPRQQSKSRTLSSTSSGYSPFLRSHVSHQVTAQTTPPSTYALIRAALAPYLTSARVTTFVLLFVLVPLLSFILRMRRRKLLLGGGTALAVTSASNAELVRKRLQAANGDAKGGFLSKALIGVVRAVGDTVKMAGRGLV